MMTDPAVHVTDAGETAEAIVKQDGTFYSGEGPSVIPLLGHERHLFYITHRRRSSSCPYDDTLM